MAGCSSLATLKSARTSFSPSPSHLEVNVDALMLRKVILLASEAMAFAIIVFPFPGGPNNSSPLGGERKPVKSSGLYTSSASYIDVYI